MEEIINKELNDLIELDNLKELKLIELKKKLIKLFSKLDIKVVDNKDCVYNNKRLWVIQGNSLLINNTHFSKKIKDFRHKSIPEYILKEVVISKMNEIYPEKQFNEIHVAPFRFDRDYIN